MSTAGEADEPDPDALPGAERMVAFVDASVAIALTLLVLPLTELVPSDDRPAVPAAEVVADNLPVFASFLLSFVVIGRLWLVHHRLYGYGGRLTPVLVLLNLAWVLSIVVLPFTTEMVATYGSQPFVLRVYVGILVLGSGLLTVMAVLMRRTGLADGSRRRPPEAFVTGSVGASIDMLLAFVLVLVVPAIGYFALFALFLDPITTRIVARLRR
ncbi:TMEM175 family protein [Actinomycetospora termitidis]|uniref:TMEM175 family protein n=1 Tax=Actinomycetospora termitidis TaxID=3053470 RepID=A0ABT7MDA0_9PSEU|nr:TMEM175 family protein [Actinomycetospora sp. Odt1-22]MDL5158635.1 TMEM175 family protein [Actinomycetospora sp. Odt1-22]